MHRLHRFFASCVVSLAAMPAFAGALADLAVFDRSTGERLHVYAHAGRHYVAGTPGNRYAVEVRNRTAGRLLAVVSVDGVNVVSGETAAAMQSGYVLHAHQRYAIPGWRKSLGEVAAFYFTALPDSYAARTGRPQNVGVIGVAVFREQSRPAMEPLGPAPAAPARDEEEASSRAPAESPSGARAAGRSDAAPSPAETVRDEDAEAKTEAAPPTAQSRERRASRLGTGHGAREASLVGETVFRRASATPDETLVIYYDSRQNLVARGIIPPPAPIGTPEPFPGRFVPDPRG